MWFYIILLAFSYITAEESDLPNQSSTLEDELRTKRQINSLPLVFPYGGTYKFIVGFSAPIQNKDNISLAFVVNFQYQYAQFQNVSELSQYYYLKDVTSREEREADWRARRDERLTFYKAAVDLLNAKGMNGMECVLRAICEAAQYPVEEEGLVGELIHILLTYDFFKFAALVSVQDPLKGMDLAKTSPDYGRSPFDEKDLEWEEAMAIYKDAAIAGRQMFSCPYIYAGCPEGQGVMELISVLTDD